MWLNQPRFLISTQNDGKLAANYNYNHYNLPFSHIMITVIISDEDMFGDRHFGSEDIMVLVSLVISEGHVIKDSCDVMCKSPPTKITIQLSLVGLETAVLEI